MGRRWVVARRGFLQALLGGGLGAAVAWWAYLRPETIPGTYRAPALILVSIPLGLLLGLLLAPDVPDKGMVLLGCFALYVFTPFLAARIDTLVEGFPYFKGILWLETGAVLPVAWVYGRWPGAPAPRDGDGEG